MFRLFITRTFFTVWIIFIFNHFNTICKVCSFCKSVIITHRRFVLLIVRTLVSIQYILHSSYEYCFRLWDVPLFDKPSLKFSFLKVVPTAAAEMKLITFKSTNLSAIICNVHLLFSSGASKHPITIICASTSPVTL